MSFFTVAFPTEAAFPAAQLAFGAIVGVVRPLLGLGAFATFLMLFRPLLTGLLRAALLVVSPRKSLKQRTNEANMKNALKLQRMARQYENSEPGLAAELRYLASRG